jgi:hypothetical protein
LNCGWPTRKLYGAGRQVLRLVHHHQDPPPGPVLGHQERFEGAQQRRLVVAVRRHAECGQDHPKGVVGVDIAGDDLGREETRLVQFGEKLADQRGLAGPDIARDHDEAFVLLQAIAQVRQGLVVVLARKEEAMVRPQFEGRTDQPVKVLEHQNTIRTPKVREFSVYSSLALSATRVV